MYCICLLVVILPWLLHDKNCSSQWYFLGNSWTGSKSSRRSITTAKSSLRSTRIKGKGWGKRKRIWGRERLLQKPLFCISAYCFMVIGLTELSVQWPIKKGARFSAWLTLCEKAWKNTHSRRRALRENLQAVYCQKLPQRFVKEEENQRETLKKKASADFVE